MTVLAEGAGDVKRPMPDGSPDRAVDRHVPWYPKAHSTSFSAMRMSMERKWKLLESGLLTTRSSMSGWTDGCWCRASVGNSGWSKDLIKPDAARSALARIRREGG